MADVPDIYADGVGVGVGPFGVTLTLQLSMPTSVALATVLAQGLNEALAAQSKMQQPDKVQH